MGPCQDISQLKYKENSTGNRENELKKEVP